MTSLKVLQVEACVKATFNFQPCGTNVTIETKTCMTLLACKTERSGIAETFCSRKS